MTEFDNDFLDMTPKTQVTKEKLKKKKKERKTRQIGLFQNEKLCGSEDTIKRIKKQSTGWQKIFANHISDKGFIVRTYK